MRVLSVQQLNVVLADGTMSDQNVIRQLLIEIDRNPAISQKRLSEEIGISVGMINWHVKRCVSKGLIKLQQAPVRRYLYYLTPDGFAEKAQLTASYLQASFDIFRSGREQYSALLTLCQANSWINIVFLGNTELTELALLVSAKFPDLNIIGIIDHANAELTRGGVTIYPSLADLQKAHDRERLDAAVACHYLVAVDQEFDLERFLVNAGLDQSRLLIPGFLQ